MIEIKFPPRRSGFGWRSIQHNPPGQTETRLRLYQKTVPHTDPELVRVEPYPEPTFRILSETESD